VRDFSLENNPSCPTSVDAVEAEMMVRGVREGRYVAEISAGERRQRWTVREGRLIKEESKSFSIKWSGILSIWSVP